MICFKEYLKYLIEWKGKSTSSIINFHKVIFKNKSKRKRNVIIYHFLVKSKPHERIDPLITASVNIDQTKILVVMKTCLRKTDETIWKSPFVRLSPLQLTPPISEQFFHDPPLCPCFKNKKPGGEQTMICNICKLSNSSINPNLYTNTNRRNLQLKANYFFEKYIVLLDDTKLVNN